MGQDSTLTKNVMFYRPHLQRNSAPVPVDHVTTSPSEQHKTRKSKQDKKYPGHLYAHT